MRASPTLVANAFNLRYHGRSITPHTARNWLLGKVMPTQDKLRVLAEWLQVSPDELRFGRAPGKTYVFEMNAGPVEMGLPDREMVDRYLSLSQEERKTVRDVVSAFVRARAVPHCLGGVIRRRVTNNRIDAVFHCTLLRVVID